MTGTSEQAEKPRLTRRRTGSTTRVRVVDLPPTLSVRELASILRASEIDTIKRLMRRGVMAGLNQIIDYDAAASVAVDFGLQPRLKAAARKSARTAQLRKRRLEEAAERTGLVPRPPVVTIMGHVDHGKTRLLDAIRHTHLMDQEAGGITQHIGAYQVEVDGQKITFLDTPGHEAFTAMRARGAQVTDICILVVAADDGVMPQTLEAIDHARAAGVPIVVAINKIDRPEANPERVKQQLADAGLVVEDWGGDVVAVEVSAKEELGIDDLLENLMLVAEMEELKADPSRPAEGVVIEAKLDKTRGPLCTVLIHNGTLRVGDTVVVGETWGRLKAMFNDAGKRIKRAGPSAPAELLGLNSVPEVGDTLAVVGDEREAHALVAKHQEEARRRKGPRAVSLSNVYDHLRSGRVRDLNIILKADVQGSLEPVRSSLEQLSDEDVKVRVIHAATGNITESDIMLALASEAVVVGFNTGIEPGARRMAENEGVSVRHYDVIYQLVDDVAKAMKGMLTPTEVEVTDGRAEVRAVFNAGKRSRVAGVYVTEGKIRRGSLVRVRRGDQVVHESTVSSLRRFKEDVREVTAGFECGVGIQDFNDFEVGDTLEFYHREQSA